MTFGGKKEEEIGARTRAKKKIRGMSKVADFVDAW